MTYVGETLAGKSWVGTFHLAFYEPSCLTKLNHVRSICFMQPQWGCRTEKKRGGPRHSCNIYSLTELQCQEGGSWDAWWMFLLWMAQKSYLRSLLTGCLLEARSDSLRISLSSLSERTHFFFSSPSQSEVLLLLTFSIFFSSLPWVFLLLLPP